MRTKLTDHGVLEQAERERPLSLRLSRLAVEALVGKDEEQPERASSTLEVALRFYLRDRDAGQPAWPYPAFLKGSEVQEDVELEPAVDDEFWNDFEAEARRQDVSAQQLAEHSAFYFAAEMDAGRITQRILDELEASEDGD